MMPSLSPQQIELACGPLSSASLIRLVSEIDDHGAIPPRALARTLTDLTAHHLRQATEQADALGLLDRSRTSLGLTTVGQDLADLYDATARWARRHNYPLPLCHFAGRIRHTFALLAEPTADSIASDSDAEAELGHVRRLLAEWFHTHQSQQSCGCDGVAA
ncbi:hypothetical protein OG604_37030 [Streptomyces sp. NBC_01231]|nr:hypothetical protein OG604_37030 [Streptomyces sp. NBC_01231]